MNTSHTRLLVALGALTLMFSAVPAGAAQSPAQSPQDAERTTQQDAGAGDAVRTVEAPAAASSNSEVVRIAQDYTLMPGDTTREVLVIAGNATIEGHVSRDVVVVLGRARLSSSASIGGSLVVVGGSGVSIAAGAKVARDLVIVGGELDAPAQFTTGGQQMIIGPIVGGSLDGLVPWISRGLLWGRPIVPSIHWIWAIVGAFFVVYLLLSMLFHRPISASAEMLAGRPLTAFVTGLLVLLLVGPLCFLLVVSVVGVVVVPFVLCAILLAWLLGRVGVIHWVGMSVVPQESSGNRLQSLRSFVIGFALVSLAYMVPLLGFVTWTMVGVFGLGGATLALVAAYRRENPPAAEPVAAPNAAAAPVYRSSRLASPAMDVPDPAAALFSGPLAAEAVAFPHAAFRDRLAAFALDVILVVFAHRLLDVGSRNISIILLLLGYHVGFWTWKATTVGGIICHLRVVRIDGRPLGFADALVRGLSSIFSLAVAGLGALWILKDPERQAWHDRIAGTYVVKVPRNWPL
jgi:uncharacterized RDD family membrane protein YckC